MKLNRMIEELCPISVQGKTAVEITGIAADSRLIQPGNLFVAIPGEQYNGTNFISQAKDRGAVGIVLGDFTSAVNTNLAQIKVADPRRALASLSHSFFHHPAEKMKMIGVTGTNGKTTVAILARSVFEDAGLSTGLIGTIYYGIGERQLPSDLTTPGPPRLPELLADMKRMGCTHVIMEVSSHAIAQQRVAGIEFATAIFTNLSREHLDYHRTIEEYRAVKMSFLESLNRRRDRRENKTVIINDDDPLSRRVRGRIKIPIITYGLSPRADLSASEIQLEQSGSSFMVNFRGRSYHGRIVLPGRYNIYNALAVVALGLSEGLRMEAILTAIEKSPGISGRLEPVDVGQEFALFVDYAHTPDGLENVLRAMRELYHHRLIVAFGCGGDRDVAKRPLMGAVAARWADEVIITSDNSRSEEPEKIIDDILSGFPRAFKKVRVVIDRRQAIESACRAAQAGDVVLIAGKGHEQKQIFRDRIIPFNDREVARDVMAKIMGVERMVGVG